MGLSKGKAKWSDEKIVAKVTQFINELMVKIDKSFNFG